MNKLHVIIEENRCIGCANCVKDCPSNFLYIENKKAKVREHGCINCGHCFAICPTNAITLPDLDLPNNIDYVSMNQISSDLLLQALKSRRTIRQYKETMVEQEKIDKILEAGRYAPTALNAQDVSFTILGNKQKEIEQICIKLLKRLKRIVSPFKKSVKQVKIDDNFIFKKAPLVIVVSSKNKINAVLASSYMELMAESLNLGVLYSGLFVFCTKLSHNIKNKLHLLKKHKVVTCLVIGYPNVEYRRIVPRKKLKIKYL